MSLQERYGTRDMTWSRWHRPPTLGNHVSYIDLDAVEYCNRCKQAVALLELARNVGQEYKPTTVLRKLAMRARVPAYLVLYHGDGDKHIENAYMNEIVWVTPHGAALKGRYEMSRSMAEDELKAWITSLHDDHDCDAWRHQPHCYTCRCPERHC